MIKRILKKIYRSNELMLDSKLLINKYGKKYNTDKINEYHSFAGKNYLDIYDSYFKVFKNKKIKMLEIGIRNGASLRTFRDYFKNGEIIGLDINPETAFSENRIKTYIGSQSSVEILEKIFLENDNINIVLDDGSHVNELTIASFNLIFNKLPEGSIYIIEDLACSYLEEKLKSDIIEGKWPGMDLNDSNIEMVNKRSQMNEFFLEHIKNLDFRKSNIEFIHFWAQICIIKKI